MLFNRQLTILSSRQATGNLHKHIIDTNNSYKREVLRLGVLDVSRDVGGRARRREGSGDADDEGIAVDVDLVSEVHLVSGVTLLEHVDVGEDIADLD